MDKQANEAREAEMAAHGFTLHDRATDPEGVWLHNSSPVWIVHYSGVQNIRAPYWQAYRAVAKVPAGRNPWTVDNRRIGPDSGFSSLDAAVAATQASA